MELRPAMIDDAEILFEWRNDPETRKNSIDQEPVEWEGHCRWLSSSIESPSRELFVGTETIPVGTSRLDYCEGYVEISYTIAPSERGKGFGRTLVEKTLKKCNGVIKASVKESNEPSIKILERFGFQIEHRKNDLLYFKLEM